MPKSFPEGNPYLAPGKTERASASLVATRGWKGINHFSAEQTAPIASGTEIEAEIFRVMSEPQ